MWIVMAIVNSATMNISTHLLGLIFVILLSIYLGEELLDHVAILYFTFEKYQLCSHYLSIFYIPTINILYSHHQYCPLSWLCPLMHKNF